MRANPHKPTPRSSQPASHAYPDRQYVSASLHNHGQATPNRQNPPAETASCESILTQSPIGDVATAIRSPEPSSCERILTRTRSSRIGPTDPDRQTVTVRVNPHTMTAARLRISQPHQPTRHRANKSSYNDTPTPPSQPIPPVRPSPCEQNLTQWPPLTSKSANPASPPAIVRTNPHTTTVKPYQTGKTRPPKRHRANKSSQIGIRNDHREISACPHIRNTTQHPANHRRPRQTVTTRKPRHTEPDRTHHQQPQQHIQPPGNACPGIHDPTHRTKPRTSATNHHHPYPPAYATQHITHPVPAARRYVSASSHNGPLTPENQPTPTTQTGVM